MANAIAGIVAGRLGRPQADVEAFDAALEEAGLYLSALHHRTALLLLTVLSGASAETVVRTGRAVADLVDSEGCSPVEFVGAMVRGMGNPHNDKRLAGLAYASSVAAIWGDELAVVVRFHTDEAPEELAFSSDGNFRPDRDQSVSMGLSIPGRILFRIARDVALLDPPIEHRFTPGTVEAIS